MRRIFFHNSSESGCSYHRVLNPLRYCADDFVQYGWKMELGDGMPSGYDAYCFHGLPNETGTIQIAKLKRSGAKFIWSVDDDWTNIPDWNPAKPSETGMALYEIVKLMADAIIVSTPRLKSLYSDVKVPVYCAKNLLEVSNFPEYPYTLEKDGETRNYETAVNFPIRIVWSGGPTHFGDLKQVTEPLIKLMEKYGPEKIALIFHGMPPPSELVRRFLHKGLYHQPSVPLAGYQRIINSIRPDIYLAPIDRNPFNLSKSNIRILEGWALKVPVVATAWGEYMCAKDHKAGLIVRDDKDWFESLESLILSHEKRIKMGISGRINVETNYNWKNWSNRAEWYSTFAGILETKVPSESDKTTKEQALGS